MTLRDDGRVEVAAPADPRTGAEAVVLDVLDIVHVVVGCMKVTSSSAGAAGGSVRLAP